MNSFVFKLGSKSLVIRAHDNGMTALHSVVTITVHVSRQSDLPPEIVSSNTTLAVYRGSAGALSRPRFDLDNSVTATKPPKSRDLPVVRVTVRDKTAYDRLFFELLPDPSAAYFVIDQYNGGIKVRPPVEQIGPGVAPASHQQTDHSISWLEPALPKLSPLAQLNSGVYQLRVRVTNASLSANDSIFIKVSSGLIFSLA